MHVGADRILLIFTKGFLPARLAFKCARLGDTALTAIMHRFFMSRRSNIRFASPQTQDRCAA
jgi:hypothetical protein